MFREVFNRDYTQNEYETQFSIRVEKFLEKIKRMKDIFKMEKEMPEEFWQVHKTQKSQLEILLKKGKILPPSFFI